MSQQILSSPSICSTTSTIQTVIQKPCTPSDYKNVPSYKSALNRKLANFLSTEPSTPVEWHCSKCSVPNSNFFRELLLPNRKIVKVEMKSPLPLDQYKINYDPEPEILKKKPCQKVSYKQEVFVKYLNPPEPPKPGDLIIKQLPDKQIEPAPPLILRQASTRVPTPPPIVLREEPPKPPVQIRTKIINIAGKLLPPPARKLVVERLPATPPKPQSILIEKWLPYKQPKRKVIFKKSTDEELVYKNPKNLLVEWQSPDVEIHQEYTSLGIFKEDPLEYEKMYANEIKNFKDLPEIAQNVKPPDGLWFASEQKEELPELEGDLDVLKLLDLDQVGLSEYRKYFSRIGLVSQVTEDSYSTLITDLFKSIDLNGNNLVSIEDAEKALFGLNARFGKKLSADELRVYLKSLPDANSGHLNLEQFETAFLNCILK